MRRKTESRRWINGAYAQKGAFGNGSAHQKLKEKQRTCKHKFTVTGADGKKIKHNHCTKCNAPSVAYLKSLNRR